ncbi:hypothetical protein DFP93_101257 [Aneurinibacillus soli]|uniref:Uncharacterized protein n=1 Tax=Aneurinibacillus soli TaxID=1500254 RepID=A0A0U4NHG2_9BACL|nr:hypothetical protein [Aneurinibacillus soli]PYE64231.1 hypothetical protein DFP93_101257 [Aneurinibacillus soli]BAU28180.1 hypothetical protein CB4_02354 [Aneurinibacillus soli]
MKGIIFRVDTREVVLIIDHVKKTLPDSVIGANASISGINNTQVDYTITLDTDLQVGEILSIDAYELYKYTLAVSNEALHIDDVPDKYREAVQRVVEGQIYGNN